MVKRTRHLWVCLSESIAIKGHEYFSEYILFGFLLIKSKQYYISNTFKLDLNIMA